IARAALERLRELLQLPRIAVNLVDLEKQEATWLGSVGRRRFAAPGLRFPLRLLGDAAALQRGELQQVDVTALGDMPEARALLASDVRWFMVVPMIVGGRLFGGLSFGGPAREFPEEQIAIALE